MNNNEYPFMVRELTHGIAGSILFDQPEWRETCRCRTVGKAETVARALSHSWHPVQVLKLHEDEHGRGQFLPYLWFPDEATCQATEDQYYKDHIAQKEAQSQVKAHKQAESEEQA